MSIRPWMKAAALAIASILATAACGDTPPEGTPAGATGAGAGTSGSSTGTGGGGGAPDCSTDPTTHEEIINACTDAEQVDKQPNLPLLNPDGSLPPLP